jgi:hypothetical protein
MKGTRTLVAALVAVFAATALTGPAIAAKPKVLLREGQNKRPAFIFEKVVGLMGIRDPDFKFFCAATVSLEVTSQFAPTASLTRTGSENWACRATVLGHWNTLELNAAGTLRARVKLLAFPTPECAYELTKLSGTVTFPVEFHENSSMRGVGKRNKTLSEPGCAHTHEFVGIVRLESNEPESSEHAWIWAEVL